MTVLATNWDELTAISTAALALLTLMLAIAAVIAAVLAKRGIDADLEATDAAQLVGQRQIEASYRPLLMDLPLEMGSDSSRKDLTAAPRIDITLPGGRTASVNPRRVYINLDDPVLMHVPLRNVGNGLAVIQQDEISIGGPVIDGMYPALASHVRIPPGETTRILAMPWTSPSEVANHPGVWPRIPSTDPPSEGANWHQRTEPPRVLTLRVPYTDFIDGQASVVVVDLEQVNDGEEWSIGSVTHVPPENKSP